MKERIAEQIERNRAEQWRMAPYVQEDDDKAIIEAVLSIFKEEVEKVKGENPTEHNGAHWKASPNCNRCGYDEACDTIIKRLEGE